MGRAAPGGPGGPGGQSYAERPGRAGWAGRAELRERSGRAGRRFRGAGRMERAARAGGARHGAGGPGSSLARAGRPGNGRAGSAALTLTGAPMPPLLAPSRLMEYLPTLYQGDDFLGRFLRIFEDIIDPIERTIDNVGDSLDPRLAPDEFLPWLSSWMGAPAQHRRRLAEAEIPRPARGRCEGPSILCSTETPFVRRVSSRTRCQKPGQRLRGDTPPRGCLPVVRLKPRNLRRDGWSTALLAAFTRSLRRLATNRVTLAMTRSPARRLRT